MKKLDLGRYKRNNSKPISEKTRKKMSDSHKTGVISDETRQKNSEWHKGKTRDKETMKWI